MDGSELKPCPFCGSKLICEEIELVDCQDCGASAYKNIWNTRTSPSDERNKETICSIPGCNCLGQNNPVDESKKSCTCKTDPNSCEYHDMDLRSKPSPTTSEVEQLIHDIVKCNSFKIVTLAIKLNALGYRKGGS